MGYAVVFEGVGKKNVLPGLQLDMAIGERSTLKASILNRTYAPHIGQIVTLYDTFGKNIFGGEIVDMDQRYAGSQGANRYVFHEFSAVSWERRLDTKYCGPKVYVGMNAGAIAKDLLLVYGGGTGVITSGEGTNVMNGADATTLGPLCFLGKSIAEALDELAARSGYIWFLRPELYLWFVPRDSAILGELEISPENHNYSSPVIKASLTDYFNTVKVMPAWSAFDAELATFAGSGGHTFTVPKPIHSIKSIRLNGVEQTSVEENSETSNWSFVWGGTTVTLLDTLPAPVSGDTIEIEYYYVGQNVVQVEAPGEVAARGRVEAPPLEDATLVTVNAATERGLSYLRGHCPALLGAPAGSVPQDFQFVFRSYEINSHQIVPGYIISCKFSTPSLTKRNLLVHSVSVTGKGYNYKDKNVDAWMTGGFLEYVVNAHEWLPVPGETQYFKDLLGTGSARTANPTPVSNPAPNLPLPEQLGSGDWSVVVADHGTTSAGQPQAGLQFTFTKRPANTTYFTIWSFLSTDGTIPGAGDFHLFTNFANIPISASGDTVSELLWTDKPETADAKMYLIACPSNGSVFSTPRTTDPRKEVTIPHAPGAGGGVPLPGALSNGGWSASIKDTGMTAVGQPQVEIGFDITERPANTEYFTVWAAFGATAPSDVSQYKDLANYPISASGNTLARGLWQDRYIDGDRNMWLIIKPSNGKVTGFPTASDTPKKLVIPQAGVIAPLEGFTVSVETQERGGVKCGRYKYEWDAVADPEYWTTNVYRIWCTDDDFVPALGFVWEIESSQVESPCYSGWWPLPSEPQYVLFKAQPVTKGGIENDEDPPMVGLVVTASGGVDARKLTNTADVPLSDFGGKLDLKRLTNVENIFLSDLGSFNANSLTNIGALFIKDLSGDLDLSRVTNLDNLNLDTLGSFNAAALSNITSLNIGSFGGTLMPHQIGTAVIIANNFDPATFGAGISIIGDVVRVTTDDTSTLIRNSGFELVDASGRPADWKYSGSVGTDTATPLAGGRSARVSNGGWIAQGPFQVSFNEEWIVQAQYTSNSVTDSNGAALSIILNNDATTWDSTPKDWQSYSANGSGLAKISRTIPTGFKYMWIVLSAGAGGNWLYDSVLLQRKLDKDRITSVSAGSIFGAIQSSQIASLVTSKLDGQITALQIAGVFADRISGQIKADKIENVYASSIIGQISGGIIQNLTITGDKIGPLAITSDKIEYVTVDKLRAGTITVAIEFTSPKININGGSYTMLISQTDGFKITVPNFASSQMSSGSLVFTGLGSFNSYSATYGHTQWAVNGPSFSAICGAASSGYIYVTDSLSNYEVRMQVTSFGATLTTKNGAIVAGGTDATKSYISARRFRFHSAERSTSDRIHLLNYVNPSTGQHESTGVIYMYDESGVNFGKIPYFQ